MASSTPTYYNNLFLGAVSSVLVLLSVGYGSLEDRSQILGASRHDTFAVSYATGDQNDKNNTHVPFPLSGEWVYVGSNRTFAAPVCCGWDKGDFKRHSYECGNIKSNTEFFRGPPNTSSIYQQIGGMACSRQTKTNKFVDEWEWQSPGLPPFDAHATCQRLRDRTVLFLGDSTIQQTSATLMNALKPGGCAPQVMMQLSDTLIHRDLGNLNRGVYFRKALKAHQPDIVVFNAGAHVRTDYNYTRMLDEVIRGAQEWRNKPKKNMENKSVTFVWKTQQPGGCTSQIFQPKNPVRAALEFDFSATPRYQLYEYDNFYRRDLYTMQRWKDELGHDARILDMRMLYSRSDAHPGSGQADPLDCLHFLSPGPLDVVAPLFQQLLAEIDSTTR